MEFYATLGTGCGRRPILREMFHRGMTGARLNLSHTSLLHCRKLLEEEYWPAAQETGVQAQLIIDLQGPELRVGRLAKPLLLEHGMAVVLGEGGIPVPTPVIAGARPGDQISLDDSALLLTVTKAEAAGLTCRVERGGLLQSRKSLAILGVDLDVPALTEEDLANLSQARSCGVTHILQPFVRGKEDVAALRRAMADYGLEDVKIMAKIENHLGLEKLDEIMAAADIICIARGDLGNSMPLWRLPSVQAEIAQRCRAARKPFFVVTQLLWSMEHRPVPTRAEVSDIYHAVLQGSSALMLTGETAVGDYPVQAMEYLVNTARCALEDQEKERAL